VQLALPGLRRLVASFEPDVVVSTYHIAGLAAAELRGRGALGCPVISFVPTFGVHELWMHPDIDGYLCISASVADYLASRTQRPTRTCGPLVRSAFLSPDGRSGHEPLPVEIPQAVRSALVVGGSLGIGDMLRAARGVTSMPGWMAVAVCGRNEQLRGQMERVPGCTALGWVEDMAGLMRVCDVLIDNAGGLSSKEALAAGLPVVTFRPIPGHGRDDALQMQRLGLTEVVEDEGDLVAALTRLAGSPAERRRRSRRGRSLFVADAAAELEELIRITERPRVAVPHAIRRGPRPLPSRRLTG
jgi:UDP-N-acetylglucosamine:LPS N-acetylglucosamine transferase